MKKQNPFLFWNTKSVEWDSLPTVRKLLKCCDVDILVNVIIEVYYNDTKKNKKKLASRLKSIIEDLRKHKHKKSEKFCLFPIESFYEEGDGIFIRNVEASLIAKEDFSKASAVLKNEGISGMSGDDYIISYGYEFEKWSTILGYRCWLGGDWSRKERYMFLANVLWELSFFGWEEDTSKDRVGSVKEDLDKEDRTIIPLNNCFEYYGFEKSTDDFEEEYTEHLGNVTNRILKESYLDLIRRIEHLDKMLNIGYKKMNI